jgi:hypothetical protein
MCCPRCSWTLPPATLANRAIPKIAPTRIEATCDVCGCLLDLRERQTGRTCAYPKCRAVVIASEGARAYQEHEHRANALRASLSGIADLPEVVALLPANERPLAPRVEARVDKLRARLTAIVEGAPTRVAKEVAKNEEGEVTPGDPLLGNACATCRGFCCLQGADHAYLNGETLARVHATMMPEKPLAEIVEHYVSYVPAESYDDSCLFHGEQGCALPRDHRADVCRTHFCRAARQLASLLADANHASRAVVAAAAGERIVRLAIIDDRSTTPLSIAEVRV